MTDFATMQLTGSRTDVAPDGSDVRVLLGLPRGGMAHFELGPGRTAKAVQHQTVEEIWYVLAGSGEMWRRSTRSEGVVALGPGVCLTISVGTEFQFRSSGSAPLRIVGVTMPPWPGPEEAVNVEGIWEPTD